MKEIDQQACCTFTRHIIATAVQNVSNVWFLRTELRDSGSLNVPRRPQLNLPGNQLEYRFLYHFETMNLFMASLYEFVFVSGLPTIPLAIVLEMFEPASPTTYASYYSMRSLPEVERNLESPNRTQYF